MSDPVRSIRALSYLDNGNLDDGPGRGKQQEQLDDTRLHEEPVPAEILDVMTRRNDLSIRDPTSPELLRLNYDIQNRIYAHKGKKLRDFIETLDQKTDVTKLWRTIKGIHGRAKREAENESITFNGSSLS